MLVTIVVCLIAMALLCLAKRTNPGKGGKSAEPPRTISPTAAKPAPYSPRYAGTPQSAPEKPVAPPTLPVVDRAPPVPPAVVTYERGVIYAEFDCYPEDAAGNRYPPDWEARKTAVKMRDGDRCQVTGCPSFCAIDVHHIVPIHESGSHRIENLVCLCQVHHWRLPFHSLVAERADNDRFLMRRAHYRWHPVRPERIPVRATFERRITASIADCENIRDRFGLQCGECHADALQFSQIDDSLVTACFRCRSGWILPRLLPGEIGPIIASQHDVIKNWGSFNFDLGLLGSQEPRGIDICHVCADNAVIGIFVPRTGRYGDFLGCSNYRNPIRSCENTDQKQQRRLRKGAANGLG